MHQYVVPVLVLATAALSSSTVLPASLPLADNSPTHSQLNDNIFSLRYLSSDTLKNIFCKELLGTNYKLPKICKTMQTRYDEADNKEDILRNIFHKGGKHNGEGFRKEQWHNYPRQLDRLHRYLYRQHTTDPDDTTNMHDSITDSNDDKYIPMFKEDFKDFSKDFGQNDISTINDAETDPLVVLKVLDGIKNELKSKRNAYPDVLSQPEYVNDVHQGEDNGFEMFNEPELRNQQNKEHEVKDMSAKKRIFSLWSRLQHMAPRGHELHHRRYLHAIYGLQDDGGALTAETRATLMRPPGSPLRWG